MHRAELQDTEEHDVELRAVRQEYRNPIALAYAFGASNAAKPSL